MDHDGRSNDNVDRRVPWSVPKPPSLVFNRLRPTPLQADRRQNFRGGRSLYPHALFVRRKAYVEWFPRCGRVKSESSARRFSVASQPCRTTAAGACKAESTIILKIRDIAGGCLLSGPYFKFRLIAIPIRVKPPIQPQLERGKDDRLAICLCTPLAVNDRHVSCA